MFQRLADGIGDGKEFPVVPPGWSIVARYDEEILTAEEAAP
jgi:hypothetical protein